MYNQLAKCEDQKKPQSNKKGLKKCVGDFVVRVVTRVFISMKSVGLLFKKVEVSSAIDCLLHQDAFHLSWQTKLKVWRKTQSLCFAFKLFYTGGTISVYV